MSVADQNAYVEYRYSPPVSPKSQPHGFKRKASSQEDELDGFKKLRLQEPSHSPATVRKVKARGHSRKTHSIDVPAVQDHETDSTEPQPTYPRAQQIHVHDAFDDFMPVDDTSDRIWIHDLDREIAEIEAEEERARMALLSETGDAYSKIPEHLLKQNMASNENAANMQLILYQEPTSLSLTEEEDAIRKTIIDARRRLREAQVQNTALPSKESDQETQDEQFGDGYQHFDPDIYMDID